VEGYPTTQTTRRLVRSKSSPDGQEIGPASPNEDCALALDAPMVHQSREVLKRLSEARISDGLVLRYLEILDQIDSLVATQKPGGPLELSLARLKRERLRVLRRARIADVKHWQAGDTEDPEVFPQTFLMTGREFFDQLVRLRGGEPEAVQLLLSARVTLS
jgi:hypothetical protein